MHGYKGRPRHKLPAGYQHDLRHWVARNTLPVCGFQASAKRLAELAAGIVHVDRLPLGPEPDAEPRAAAKELGHLGLVVAETDIAQAVGDVAA